jgi:23S rRNA (uracil1939-C5)-methyltransferase
MTTKPKKPQQNSTKKHKDGVEVTCTEQSHDGKGIVQWLGKPLAVSGLLPQERAVVQVLQRKHSVQASLVRVLTPSSKRVKAPCRYFDACGGCQLQHMSYTAQLKFKEDYVRTLLSPFGEVNPIIGMDEPFRYRNKSHMTYGVGPKRKNICGMYAENTHQLIDLDTCLVQTEKADAIAQTIKSLLPSFKLVPYDEDSGQGHLRHILIKTGFRSGQIMLVLVVGYKMLPSKANFVKAILKAHPEITTVLLNVNNNRTSMVLGQQEFVLYGSGVIEEELCGLRFKISAKSFFQINPIQTEKLYDYAMSLAELTGKESVVDAYCGTGTIGLIASRQAKEVIGIELNSDAIKDAQVNAKLNDINNIKFVEGDATDVLLKMAQKKQKVDVLFMDPPRSGSTDQFIRSTVALAPEKIVYISCNPQTQQRDVQLLEDLGYKVKAIQPVDLFPMTYHVEAIILMTRSGSGEKK